MAAFAFEPTVTLVSSTGVSFVLPVAAANMCGTVRNMLEDITGAEVPLPEVPTKALALVAEYCRHHQAAAAAAAASAAAAAAEARAELDADAKAELDAWDKDFVHVDQGTLFELILAANYLACESLLSLTCETVASMIRGKSPEQIRATFNIKKDFTPEEEQQLLRENQWAFE